MTDPAPDDDDPVVRSMRSVWLTMREEDPPQGGLAELMAAARAKAEVMAPPKEPWWQRVFATLRRPPVLAMATVVLLVGGAVIIGKRQADVTVERMAPAGPTITHSADDETRDRLEDPAAPPAAATIDPHGALPGSGTTELAKDQGTVPPRKIKKSPRDPVVKSAQDERPKLEVAGGQTKAAGTEPMIATDSDAGEDAPVTNAPAGSAPTLPQPEPPPDVSRPATIAQLVEQSAAAAARGDCATVKTTSARLRKLSPAVYNDQIAKNAAIAKCLK